MKLKKILIVATLTVLIGGALPVSVLARTVDEIKSEENAASKQGQTISDEIDQSLTEVNKKYQALEKLKADVTTAEQTIADTEKEIEETQASIQARTESMSERMKDMQLQGSKQQPLQILLEADSFSDFISRAYAVTVLQNAEKSKIESLFDDRDKLDKLKESLVTSKADLVEKQTAAVEDAKVLDTKIADLNTKLTDNKELLAKLATDRQTEETRIAAEAAKKAAAEAEAKAKEEARVAADKQQAEKAEKEKAEAPTTPVAPPVTTNPTPPVTPPTTTPPTTPPGNGGGGNTGNPGTLMNVQSTAYSVEEGGWLTATGIDLRVNPWVIAVDPRVIPLGTMVEVPGYGIAIAGDTGGAIKGNIIDVHFNTIKECLNWGRRNITIKLL